ncbi:MAG: hypothetical protein U0797_06400 [Gemmataceae bacterium]
MSVTLVRRCSILVLLTLVECSIANDKTVFEIAEAKSQWQKARSLAAGTVSGTMQAKAAYRVKPSPDATGFEDSREVRQNRDCASLLMSRIPISDNAKVDFLIGFNTKYAFQIRRSLGNENWALDQIDLGGDGSQLPRAPRAISGLPASEWAHIWVCAHFYALDHRLPLERLVDKPFFRVTQTKSVVVDGDSFVRIDFESPYPLDSSFLCLLSQQVVGQ